MDCIVCGLSLGADRYEGGNDILGSIKITKFWPAERPSGTHEQPSSKPLVVNCVFIRHQMCDL
jgi:hypothetical protein